MSGWILILALVVFCTRQIWPKKESALQDSAPLASNTPAVIGEDMRLLQEIAPECARALFNYLSAGTPEERNQFVLQPVATASKMNHFDSLNPINRIDPSTLKPHQSGVLHPPGQPAAEIRWTTEDGQVLDAVFRKESDEWRLDWEHFIRYSDLPWSLFLAGSGPDEGEFRLLVRERLAEERKHEDSISIVLYAPRFGCPDETGFQSPEFLVSRNHKDGKLLDAAFELAANNKAIFGSKLPNINPDDMIRARVRVKRSESGMKRSFEITEVLACHWHSIDDPGIGVSPESGSEDAPAQDP